MNNFGQADIGAVVSAIFGIFVLILMVVYVIIPLLSMTSDNIREQQVQPYKQIIQQKDAEISSMKDQLSQTNKDLEQLNQTYEKLVRENITKKDIEEIKYSFNNTQSEINLLNQKFDIVNTNFISVYNQTLL